MENEFETNLKHTIQEPIYLSEEEEEVYLRFPKNIPGWKISADRNQVIMRECIHVYSFFFLHEWIVSCCTSEQ